jgi:hypothetical protein
MPWTDDSADELVVHRGDGRVLFYLVTSESLSEEDWRSHYEKSERPRKYEIRNALEHMGLSMWDSPEPLLGLAERWPKLGRFVANVELVGERGVWFAETGPEGHCTVWGRPADLQRCVSLPVHPL